MLTVNSQNNLPIRLTEERWQHITKRHPEMITQQAEVLETVSAPETIQAGDSGELLAVRFYPQTPLTSKFLVVAYREVTADDGFILTAYFTNRPSTRRVTLWTQ
ncbi:hypothetical protein [Stenomitos frigidus]|uniref:DUF4258 domain-containing protein n=1 Tax=Stenomitos frigidus ULC18 TaxID=2107698 RepID=A0A2T1DSZ1_9CYAN|nr:hypothetical protein [Stenomitos frigidus]PSB23617.1 hypothetical protein C7B82_30545 [Stenomitos frigidus ULC18]